MLEAGFSGDMFCDHQTLRENRFLGFITLSFSFLGGFFSCGLCNTHKLSYWICLSLSVDFLIGLNFRLEFSEA